MENITVLGIDPGLSLTGFALLSKRDESIELIKCGVIKTSSDKQVYKRLTELYFGLSKILDEDRIDEVAVEKIFFNSNLKTVVNVSEARGVILLAVSNYKKPIFEYTPLEVKKAMFGNGRASKKEIQESIKCLLNLEKIPQPDDASDAIAIALCHIYSLPYYNRSIYDIDD